MENVQGQGAQRQRKRRVERRERIKDFLRARPELWINWPRTGKVSRDLKLKVADAIKAAGLEPPSAHVLEIPIMSAIQEILDGK